MSIKNEVKAKARGCMEVFSPTWHISQQAMDFLLRLSSRSLNTVILAWTSSGRSSSLGEASPAHKIEPQLSDLPHHDPVEVSNHPDTTGTPRRASDGIRESPCSQNATPSTREASGYCEPDEVYDCTATNMVLAPRHPAALRTSIPLGSRLLFSQHVVDVDGEFSRRGTPAW